MPSLWRRIRDRRNKSKNGSNENGFGRLFEDAAESSVSVPQTAPPQLPHRRNSAGDNERQQEHAKRAVRFASQANLHAAQPLNSTDSPALSRASSLSSTDLDYLSAQAYRTEPPKPMYRAPQPPLVRSPEQQPAQASKLAPQVDWQAFSGAFAPQHRVQTTRYPVPPLTPQQLNELAGAFAPPAPPIPLGPAVTFR
ncbi:hypothetical protein DL95DRAFT_450129 [Leptodontidium sp. 2 PMI_412]|nr:hypothetical protein DL95DRAFT_450129 [Leptodontidium sp. 2 PMI_412]